MRRAVPTQTNLKYTASRLFPGVGEFPGPVLVRKTASARSVSGRNGGLAIGEKDPMPDVAAFGDRSQRRRTIEPAANARAAVPAQCAGSIGQIRLSVRPDQFPLLLRFHRGLTQWRAISMTR